MIVGQASMTHMLLGILYMRKPREREKKKKVFKMPWGLDINMANAQYVPRYMVTLS